MHTITPKNLISYLQGAPNFECLLNWNAKDAIIYKLKLTPPFNRVVSNDTLKNERKITKSSKEKNPFPFFA